MPSTAEFYALLAADDAAGDFCPGISGGLCGKIVWVTVDDDGPTDDLRDGKAVGQDRHQRAAVISE